MLHSRSIDTAEVTTALKHLGEYKSPKQVAALIKEVDADTNGTIEFAEFAFMVGEIRLGAGSSILGKIVSANKVSAYKFTDAELEELKTEFGSFDTSGDGRYTPYCHCACSLQRVGDPLIFKCVLFCDNTALIRPRSPSH